MDVTAAERLIFAARHRVVLDAAPAGDGAAVARQLDAVLMCAGFKCSRQLLERLAACEPEYLVDKAVQVIGWARELAGDHVQHNTYFIDFPRNVPDTLEFWSGLLADAVRQHAEAGNVTVDGVWGPDGVFAQAADRPTRFIRVMVLPAAYMGKSSVDYLNEEDKAKPKSQAYKIFADMPLTAA